MRFSNDKFKNPLEKSIWQHTDFVKKIINNIFILFPNNQKAKLLEQKLTNITNIINNIDTELIKLADQLNTEKNNLITKIKKIAPIHISSSIETIYGQLNDLSIEKCKRILEFYTKKLLIWERYLTIVSEEISFSNNINKEITEEDERQELFEHLRKKEEEKISKENIIIKPNFDKFKKKPNKDPKNKHWNKFIISQRSNRIKTFQ